jgi:hypothetical protein
MGSPILPGWDTFILTLPFLGVLGIAMFRLDERLAAPKIRLRGQRFFCEAEGKGTAFLSDPDGTRWQKGGGYRQIEARLIQMDHSEQEERVERGRKVSAACVEARTYVIDN